MYVCIALVCEADVRRGEARRDLGVEEDDGDDDDEDDGGGGDDDDDEGPRELDSDSSRSRRFLLRWAPVVKPGMVFLAASICVCAAFAAAFEGGGEDVSGEMLGDVDRDDTDRAEVEDEAPRVLPREQLGGCVKEGDKP